MKIKTPGDAKLFFAMFGKEFFQSYLDQGMDKHELWSEICEMWRWSHEKNMERTEKGWNQFARNWMRKKGVAASANTQKAIEASGGNSSAQPILMRISRDYKYLNVTQLELIRKVLATLHPEDQEQVLDKVAMNHSKPLPKDFKAFAQDIRNSKAMMAAPNVLQIPTKRNDSYIAEQCAKYGATDLWDLVKKMKEKKA